MHPVVAHVASEEAEDGAVVLGTTQIGGPAHKFPSGTWGTPVRRQGTGAMQDEDGALVLGTGRETCEITNVGHQGVPEGRQGSGATQDEDACAWHRLV